MSSFLPGDVLTLTKVSDCNANTFNLLTSDDVALYFVSGVEKHEGEDGRSQETFAEFHTMAWRVAEEVGNFSVIFNKRILPLTSQNFSTSPTSRLLIHRPSSIGTTTT